MFSLVLVRTVVIGDVHFTGEFGATDAMGVPFARTSWWSMENAKVVT
jgi:hypothetical protein